jgi:hypothetical protein
LAEGVLSLGVKQSEHEADTSNSGIYGIFLAAKQGSLKYYYEK